MPVVSLSLRFIRRARMAAMLMLFAAVAAAGISAARADDQLPPDVLKKVKNATVYIRVTLASGAICSGSGFFTGAANTIVTNGHVLGMLSPQGRQPKKIEVVINSGTKDEKTFPAKIAQIAPDTDLAVIFVTGKDFPEHLQIGDAKDLVETQGLYVVGFPLGEKLNKSVTIRKTSVSSLRKNKSDGIQDVQVEGGMDHGNSGGPVIDAKGQVVGVAVSGIGGTQINFAIPGETVKNFLVGRYSSRLTLAPYTENGVLKLPMIIHIADPLQRIRSVSMETWIGKPEEQKRTWSPKDGAQTLPDDTPHQKFEFIYDKVAHDAVGEVILPEIPKDKAYWMQISYARSNGSAVGMPPVKFLAKLRPVERKPTTLVYEHHAGSPNNLKLTSVTDLKIRQISGTDMHYVEELLAEMDETLVGKPDPEGTATGQVAFTKLEIKRSIDKEKIPINPEVLKALQVINLVKTQISVDKQGDMRMLDMAVGKTTPLMKAILADKAEDAILALEAVTVPVPGKEVTFDKPWKAQRKIKLGSGDSNEPGIADITFTYHGTRSNAEGPVEAVVFLKGAVRGKEGSDQSVGGSLSGTAVFDLKNKQVKYTDVTMNLDLDLPTRGGGSLQANGTLKIVLNRVPKDQAKTK
jgi:V8-like Glu-specific endopeptidase